MVEGCLGGWLFGAEMSDGFVALDAIPPPPDLVREVIGAVKKAMSSHLVTSCSI